MLLIGTVIWCGIEAQGILHNQQDTTTTLGRFVASYLQDCEEDLRYIASRLEKKANFPEQIRSLLKHKDHFQALYLLDSQSRVKASVPNGSRIRDFSGLLSDLPPQPTSMTTAPYYSGDAKTIVTSMIAPARNNHLVLAELNLKSLQEAVRAFTNQIPNGQAIIADAYGNLLAHPEMAQVNRQTNLGHLDILADLPQGQTSSTISLVNDRWSLLSATTVPGKKWKILIKQNAFALFTPALWPVSLSFAALATMLLLFALAAQRRMHKRVILPLNALNQEIDRLTQGTEPAQAGSSAESVLGNSFTELSRLHENFRDMQNAIWDREISLWESKEHLRITLHSIGDGVITTDTEGLLTSMNPVAETLTGWTEAQAKGHHIQQVLRLTRENRTTPHLDPIQEVLQTGEIRDLPEHAQLHALDGHVYSIADTAAPIRDTDGRLVGVVMVFRDETEHVRQDALLKESRERLNLALEAGNIGLWDWHVQTGAAIINANWAEMLGYSVEELQPVSIQTWRDLCHPEDLKMADGLLTQYFNGELPIYTCELRMRHKNGHWAWVIARGKVTEWGDSGEPVRITGTHVDITDRKIAEDELRYMSFHDALTGLYNRNFFEEEMHRLSTSRAFPLGIIICDVDGLKLTNDTLGHEAGDQLLRTTAKILTRTFRREDIIARIGGDEFAVLLPNTDTVTLKSIVKRLRQVAEEANDQDPALQISLSIGYALNDGTQSNLHTTFEHADNAMYREKMQQEKSSRSAIVQALTKALEARDHVTDGHCDRIQDSVLNLAACLDLSEKDKNELLLLARFHDLGKVGIRDDILFKPGPLTEEEFAEMREHSRIGYDIARAVPDLSSTADWILKHHEWWNGKGYPLGLKGEDIPLPSRILSIADAYDAMTSDRPYRKAMTHEQAIAELKRNAGTQFDPELVRKFVTIAPFIPESIAGA